MRPVVGDANYASFQGKHRHVARKARHDVTLSSSPDKKGQKESRTRGAADFCCHMTKLQH